MAKTILLGHEIPSYKNEKDVVILKPSDVQEILGKVKKEEKLSFSDMILALFYAQDKPIKGMILLMKEIFLMQKEFEKDENIRINDAYFTSYKYGPYSVDVDDFIDIMEEYGLIISRGRKSSNKEIFLLTDKGVYEGKKAFSKLNEDQQRKLRDLRKGWDQLGVRGILKLVYTKYPDYIDKSEIKQQVLYKKGIKRKRG
jgi:predicted CopG family antitoxin